jgi:DNA-binding protein Fis
MNPDKAHYYQPRPHGRVYHPEPAASIRSELNRDLPSAREFAHDSYAHTNRLAESIRLKLLKVLTLTLLRELEGVGIDPTRVNDEFNLQTEVEHFEAELIRSALIMTGGRQRRAARLLGMKVTTLHSKIRRYGLNADAGNVHHDHGFTKADEPTAAEAIRTSLELVEAIFESHHKAPAESDPEIHVTGEN